VQPSRYIASPFHCCSWAWLFSQDTTFGTAPDGGYQRSLVWPKFTHRVDRGPEAFGYTTHGCKPTPLLVPIPGQLLGQRCERKLAWCTSFQHRFYQIRGEKCRTDELAHVTFAFAQRGAIMRNDTSPLKRCSSH
jgi:hypothetical protein